MRFDQSGQYQPTVEVDERGVRTHECAGSGIVTDEGDAAALYGQR